MSPYIMPILRDALFFDLPGHYKSIRIRRCRQWPRTCRSRWWTANGNVAASPSHKRPARDGVLRENCPLVPKHFYSSVSHAYYRSHYSPSYPRPAVLLLPSCCCDRRLIGSFIWTRADELLELNLGLAVTRHSPPEPFSLVGFPIHVLDMTSGSTPHTKPGPIL